MIPPYNENHVQKNNVMSNNLICLGLLTFAYLESNLLCRLSNQLASPFGRYGRRNGSGGMVGGNAGRPIGHLCLIGGIAMPNLHHAHCLQEANRMRHLVMEDKTSPHNSWRKNRARYFLFLARAYRLNP